MIQNISPEIFFKKLSNSAKNEFDGSSFVLELAGTDEAEVIERIEHLTDGDVLMFDFVRRNEKNVVRVCNQSDEEVGVLSAYSDMIVELVQEGILKIDSVIAKGIVPLSKRKKGSKKALAYVRVYFSVADKEAYEENETESFSENTEEVSLEENAIESTELVAEEPALEEDISEAEETFVEESALEVDTAAEEETFVEESALEVDTAAEEETFVEELTVEEVSEPETVIAINEVEATVDVKQEPAQDDEKQNYANSINYYNTLTNESVKCELKQIIDEGIWDTGEMVSKGYIDIKPMVDALAKSLNIIRSSRITDKIILTYVLENVSIQFRKVFEGLVGQHNKVLEYNEQLARLDISSTEPSFSELQTQATMLFENTDNYLLRYSEGLDKLWVSVPKDKNYENIVERVFEIATQLYDLSKSVVVIMDKNSRAIATLKYVSNTLIKEAYEKWESVYEYIPFVKAKKFMYYKKELDDLNAGLSRTKEYFEKMKLEKEELIKSIHDELVECESQLSSLGIFSFSSKKYCRERIIELGKEEEHAKKDLNAIIEDYNNTTGEQYAKVEFVKSKVMWYSDN